MHNHCQVYIACLALAVTLFAGEKDLAGVYTGKWSGASGAAGDFRTALALSDGKIEPDVMFTMGSTEVKTKVTHIAVDAMNPAIKYQFDLNGFRLQPPPQGTPTPTALH